MIRQEFMQRRVDQPYGDRQPVHCLEQPREVRALYRQQLREMLGALLGGAREDHGLHDGQTLGFEEHVLGAA
jgi:hypothetical protein